MKLTFSTIGQVLAWIIFIGAFSCIGLATESPKVMVPLYGIGIILILGIILLTLMRKKRQSFEDVKTSKYVPMISGIMLLILSLFFPTITITGFLHNLVGKGVIFLFTILMMGLGMGSVWLINVLSQKIKIMTLVGYLLLIFVAALPAISIASVDASSGTLGVLYFITMLTALAVWAGFTLLYKSLNLSDE